MSGMKHRKLGIPAGKRVFLFSFSSNIMHDVARGLQDKGVEVIYMSGSKIDFRRLVNERSNDFSNTIFHQAEDILRVIPPRGIDISSFPPPSESIIKKLSKYESQILSLIERETYLNLSYQEKKHLHYSYLRFWYGMIKKYKPDAVLFSMIPHSGVGFMLHVLVQEVFRDVQSIMLYPILTGERSVVLRNIEVGAEAITDNLRLIKNAKIDDLSPDVKGYYKLQTNPNADATPTYLASGIARRSFLRLPTISTIYKNITMGSFYFVTRAYLRMFFRNVNIMSTHADLTGIQFKLRSLGWKQLNKKLVREYVSIQESPDFSKEFIYVPLHYQPEASTSPLGGIYEDQLLMVETLAAALPNDWIIYIKEHPAQLSPHITSLPPRFRYEGYFKSMANLKNVQILPINTSTYDLIGHAKAIATVTGTAGIESIFRDIPALIFGFPFYMHCEGAFRVSSVGDCRRSFEKIQSGYKLNQQKVLNFFAALDKASFRAKDYRVRSRNYKEDPNLPREEIVRNLTRAFLENLTDEA